MKCNQPHPGFELGSSTIPKMITVALNILPHYIFWCLVGKTSIDNQPSKPQGLKSETLNKDQIYSQWHGND